MGYSWILVRFDWDLMELSGTLVMFHATSQGFVDLMRLIYIDLFRDCHTSIHIRFH